MLCFGICHALPEDDLQKYSLAESCRAGNFDQTVTVKHVIDGDTIILTDERHIRLTGINTPETGHDGRKSQIGADQALYYLSGLLKSNKDINLVLDETRVDHYGRTLAHLFLKDGTNIQALLLTRGLATPLIIPPNTAFIDCYETSTKFAQAHQIGLWALKQYQPIPAESISKEDRGYRIVTGNVMRVGESKSAIWINLTKRMALRITKVDLKYFSNDIIKELAGKEIMARGSLYFLNGEHRMQIRHPVDLKIIDSSGRN